MRLYELIPYAFYPVMILIMIFGLHDLPADYQVDIGYIIGILTASSILFGFWVVLIEKQPKKELNNGFTKKLLERFSSFLLPCLCSR